MPEEEVIEQVVEEAKEAPVVETPPPPKEYVRTIQPKDAQGNPVGSPHVYKGASEQEVMDKMADAIANGTLKIRELSRAQKLENQTIKVPEGAELEPDIVVPKPRELTADERFQLAEKMKNPETVVEGYRELHKATTGRTPEEDAAAKEKAEREAAIAATRAAAQQFSESHPEYFSSVENGKIMGQYMFARKMSFTSVKNYEIAFKELSTDGLLETEPVEAPEPAVEPPAPVTKPVAVTEPPRTEAAPAPRARTAFPSSLSRDQASGTGAAKPKKPSAAEIAMMNASQYKAYLESIGKWGQ